jgi:DNA-binding IclR family transcriptional regulator
MQRPRAPRAASPPSSGTVLKALRILGLVGQAEQPIGVVEIARRLGLHKSSVSRLLATLGAEGFVTRDPITERFVVGSTLVTLAGAALRQMDLRQIARDVLERLAAATRETVNLAVPVRGGVVNVDKIASPHYIRDIGWIGRQTPYHCTATGKALIAWLTPPERRALLGPKLPRHTPRTICTWTELERDLAITRRRGYALGLEELEPGLIAVAAPIPNHDGQVVATVSVSGPSMRLTPAKVAEYAGWVVASANEIAERLRRSILTPPAVVAAAAAG